MTLTEKRAWCQLVATLGAYTWYLALVLGRWDGADTPYAAVLLWSLGVSTVLRTVAEITLSLLNPRGARARDERDRAIDRRGDQLGQAFALAGGAAALAMALAQWHWFWIANVIYLGFVLSTVLGCVVKVVLNHTAVPAT